MKLKELLQTLNFKNGTVESIGLYTKEPDYNHVLISNTNGCEVNAKDLFSYADTDVVSWYPAIFDKECKTFYGTFYMGRYNRLIICLDVSKEDIKGEK